MATSIFDDRAIEPADAQLEEALGARRPLWDALLDALLDDDTATGASWSYYKKSTGWLLRLQRKKLTVCTILPTADALAVVFLLPERAVVAARAEGLPDPVLDAIDGADVSRFGHAFTVNVRREADIEGLSTLARVKVATARR